jgi:hypothetical protein
MKTSEGPLTDHMVNGGEGLRFQDATPLRRGNAGRRGLVGMTNKDAPANEDDQGALRFRAIK